MTVVLYGSSVADTTFTNGCDMSTTTGGTETSKTSTVSGGGNIAEVYSQGGSVTTVSSIPATPTGHGWYAKQMQAGTYSGNWSASINSSINSYTPSNSHYTLRMFKYSGGSYTSISTITGPYLTDTAKVDYSYSSTSFTSFSVAVGDYLAFDMWYTDTTGAGGEDTVIYESNSATAGVANDMQISISTFTASGGHQKIFDGFGGMFS